MSQVDPSQLKTLMEDIRSIKTVIDQNTPVISQIATRSLRSVAVFGGLAMITWCLIMQYLISAWGSYGQLPPLTKIIMVSIAAAGLIAAGTLKWIVMVRSAHAFDPDATGAKLLQEIHSSRYIISLHVPVGLVIVFLVVYSSVTGNASLVVPIVAIGTGILWNAYSAMFRTGEFLVGGLTFMVSGCIVLVYREFVPPLIGFASSVGLGTLLFGIVAYIRTFAEERKPSRGTK